MIRLLKQLLCVALTGGCLSVAAHAWDTAMFAGGCFWCVESTFEKVIGVQDVISGYAGGHVKSPSYSEVSSGTSGHREVIQVLYDASVVSYTDLLDVFWKEVNPTDENGQFVDRGFQYSTAIYYYTDKQKVLAEKSREALTAAAVFEKPVITPILKAPEFYPAEDYHQDYYKKNPVRYKLYRFRSGRDRFLEAVWEDADQPEE